MLPLLLAVVNNFKFPIPPGFGPGVLLRYASTSAR